MVGHHLFQERGVVASVLWRNVPYAPIKASISMQKILRYCRSANPKELLITFLTLFVSVNSFIGSKLSSGILVRKFRFGKIMPWVRAIMDITASTAPALQGYDRQGLVEETGGIWGANIFSIAMPSANRCYRFRCRGR